MQVYKVLPEGNASNSYILTSDGKNAVVVDPSEPRITEILDGYGLLCKAVLLTHGHFDHVGGCGKLFGIGAVICCGEREKPLVFSESYRNMFGGVFVPYFEVGRTFKDGEEFELCGINFKAISTPGHSEGSTCYVAEDKLFSGDTLFYAGVGRTDLPTGDFRKISGSVRKLYALDGNFTVYCGHGPDTTLDFERKNNPYIRNP